jgi:uncharacterized protein (TIRG00374 family)
MNPSLGSNLSSHTPVWSNTKRRALIAVGLLAASAYVVGAILTDSAQLGDAFEQLGWQGCCAVLGLSVLNYGLRFLRWQYYLSKLGRTLPRARHFLIYLSGFAFTVSPAKAGEAVRSLYLREHGVTYSESIAAVFVERLLDMFAIVVLASLVVVDYPVYRPLLAAVSILLVVLLVCVCQESLPGWIETKYKQRSGRLARLLAAFASLLRSSRRLLHPEPLLTGLAIGVIAWGAEGVGFRIICAGLHIEGSLVSFLGLYAMAVLAGSAAVFLPAGIGGTEIVMTTLLVKRGASLRTAILATLLCRLATLWFAVLLGVAAAATVEVSARRLSDQVAP